ncbi:MAG: SprT-like domain-containing protein [Pirellulales bacterium]|nr:SprT-like domain-containing protein [Pirellulales bacterium]
MKLTDARNLAKAMMKQHGLLPAWSFHFDNSKVRFGLCNYSRRIISLSRHLVAANPSEKVRETILHEIAHALAPRGAGHNAEWRAIALSIGCQGGRCYGEDVVRPKPPFKGTCPGCQRVIYRHRRSHIACGTCSPTFDPRFLIQWSENQRR